MKSKSIATLTIPKGMGKSILDDRGHIDFWKYANFNLIDHVIAVAPP
jgi:hypothetical protein